MLRNRVLVISSLVVGLVLVLELAGIVVGMRLEQAFRQSSQWGREVSLNLELDAFAVRAAGEAASAILTGDAAHRSEALEALDEANARYRKLVDLDLASDEVRSLAMPVREMQKGILHSLADGIEPLRRGDRFEPDGRHERVEAVYGYERLVPELRARAAVFERSTRELSIVRLAKWRRVSDVLGIARVAALVLLVLLLTRLLQRKLVSPLKELAGAAERVRAGELSVRVGERGDFEIGALQSAFNAMTHSLEDYRSEADAREAQLQEALLAAQTANRAKSTFVAGVSHELRTPMHGVLGSADLLLMGQLEPLQRARVENIRTSAESLLAIVNDILDLSRLEAGRLEIHFAPVALRRQVLDVMATIESQARAQGLDARCEIAPEVPQWVLGDAGRLRQVLVNLLGNAVKFTESGFVSLRLWCEADRRRLNFEVADSGPGIAAESISQIFEPFEQVDRTISRQHGGTGLGLAICRMLVEAMGGHLRVDSEPGHGARFHFSLALPPCDSPPEWQPVRLPPQGGIRGRLLVAEDHPVNQALVQAMLDELGCSCDLAADGLEVLAATERQDFDLILMDCQMPHLDGLSATRAIRERESGAGRRTVIVAMTAGAMQSDRDAALSAGMDDFLAKPFTVAQLRETLSRWLAAGG